MGDYKARSALHHFLKGTLYQYLGTGIYRRCSFVQNEHWRQGEHYSCDTEKLFLSCGDSAVAV